MREKRHLVETPSVWKLLENPIWILCSREVASDPGLEVCAGFGPPYNISKRKFRLGLEEPPPCLER